VGCIKEKNVPQQIRISAKTLGQLALPSFCPRCFWLKARCPKLPFQMFPGIFSSIDSYSKKVTSVHWQTLGEPPKWLSKLGDFVQSLPVPHHSRFFVIDEVTGIKLTGVPDAIFAQIDASFFIGDYKTSRFTAGQDRMLPLYEVQLNGYAHIGNRCGFRPVSGLGLIYYEPQTDLDEERLASVLGERGFSLPFTAKLLPIALRPEELIPPLLQRAKEILTADRPPDRTAGCEECARVDALVALVSGERAVG
jgi:hypothetical protein